MRTNETRSNPLESIFLDIDEMLEDLQVEWVNHSEYEYNPSAFSKLKSAGDNYMCCCPFHVESNPSFGILKEYPYTWNCFGCGRSGTLPQLVAHAMELASPENAMGEVYGEQYILKNYAIIDAKERPKIDINSILDGKDADRRVSHLESEIHGFVGKRHPYLYSRGFSERTLAKYEVGYDEVARAMAFPVRTSKGKIRFIKRRFVDRKGFLNETNLDKKDIIYGLYYLLQAREVIPEIFLNESETDTMACYQGRLPAGAILGRILFQEQVIELQKAGVKVANLFYDNDLYGLRAAYQSYRMLSKTPIRVNMILYPGVRFGIDTLDEEEVLFKDANDLLKANLLSQIEIVPFETCGINWSKIVE